jgi:hypothetical protein
MRPLLTVCVLLGSAACSIHKSELDETLEWMDNTYNPHENISGAHGHGRSAWYTRSSVGSQDEVMVTGQTETFTFNGCDLTLKTEDDKRARTAKEIYTTAVYRFNLRDIDPSSIKVETASHLGGLPCEGHTTEELATMGMNCDHAAIGFSTRSAAGLISEKRHAAFLKLTGSDHNSDTIDKTGRAFFVFDDVEYANRFAKAFAHAIQLCGGKPSPF